MPSRPAAIERTRRKRPKKTCCGLYLLRSESEAPGKRKKHRPSSHWGGEGGREAVQLEVGKRLSPTYTSKLAAAPPQ